MSFQTDKNMKPTTIIFGASRGIGKNIAETLAPSHNLVICSKSIQDLQNIKSTFPSVTVIKCDVRFDHDIKMVISECMEEFGGVDVVIYNPGMNI